MAKAKDFIVYTDWPYEVLALGGTDCDMGVIVVTLTI